MYVPPKAPTDLAALARYVEEQLRIVSQTFGRGLAREIEVLHAAPKKLYDGLVVIADGSDWDPGSGAGTYVYRSGAWRPLE